MCHFLFSHFPLAFFVIPTNNHKNTMHNTPLRFSKSWSGTSIYHFFKYSYWFAVLYVRTNIQNYPEKNQSKKIIKSTINVCRSKWCHFWLNFSPVTIITKDNNPNIFSGWGWRRRKWNYHGVLCDPYLYHGVLCDHYLLWSPSLIFDSGDFLGSITWNLK